MSDNFADYSVGLGSPYVGAEAVVPSDTVSLSSVSRALYVGGAGDLSLVFDDGTTAVLSAATAGSFLPVRVSRVNSTGTTATNVVSLF